MSAMQLAALCLNYRSASHDRGEGRQRARMYDLTEMMENVRENIEFYGKDKDVGGFDRNKNYPDALASAVSELGVQHIFGANQHAFANGYDAMCATVTNLHMHSVGMIGLTTTDPQKINTRVVRVNGVSVGL